MTIFIDGVDQDHIFATTTKMIAYAIQYIWNTM